MTDAEHRPSLLSPRLWEHRRVHYCAVFERALLLLRNRVVLPEDEPNLTRELRFTVVTARRELDPEGRFDRPHFESQNLADPDSEFVQPHEYKRPDIQWVHDDESASDDRHREKSFVIECKRLGSTTASGWNLNYQYVFNGISRFRSTEWRYGSSMAEGAMIGFVQSMDLALLHAEINQHASEAATPALELATEMFSERGVSRLVHDFTRTFPVSPFRVTHFWLDVRDIPRHTTPKARKVSSKRRKSVSPSV